MRISKRFKSLKTNRTKAVPTIPVSTVSVGARFGIQEKMPKGDAVTLSFVAYNEEIDESSVVTAVMTALEARDLAMRLSNYATELEKHS